MCDVLYCNDVLMCNLPPRSLRRQHRVRLHIHFFSSLLAADVMSVMWDLLVAHHRLITAGTEEETLTNKVTCVYLQINFATTCVCHYLNLIPTRWYLFCRHHHHILSGYLQLDPMYGSFVAFL